MNENSKTDWTKLEAMTDDEIDTSDILPLDETFFAEGELRLPKSKPMISIRIDAGVLEWFKVQYVEYQVQIYLDSM